MFSLRQTVRVAEPASNQARNDAFSRALVEPLEGRTLLAASALGLSTDLLNDPDQVTYLPAAEPAALATKRVGTYTGTIVGTTTGTTAFTITITKWNSTTKVVHLQVSALGSSAIPAKATSAGRNFTVQVQGSSGDTLAITGKVNKAANAVHGKFTATRSGTVVNSGTFSATRTA